MSRLAVAGNKKPGPASALERFNKRAASWLVGSKARMSWVGPDGREQTDSWTYVKECILSPDRKRLLWLSPLGAWVVAELDGSAVSFWWTLPDVPSSIVWLRTSRQWVELVAADQRNAGDYRLVEVVVRGLKAGRERRYPLPPDVPDGIPIGVARGGAILLLASQAWRPTAELDLLSITLNGARPSAQVRKVKLPRKIAVLQMSLSPDGSRMGWLCSDRDAAAPSRYEVWVSGPGGENVTTICQFAAGRTPLPDHLSWTPDGGRLTWTMAGELVGVKVPRFPDQPGGGLADASGG